MEDNNDLDAQSENLEAQSSEHSSHGSVDMSDGSSGLDTDSVMEWINCHTEHEYVREGRCRNMFSNSDLLVIQRMVTSSIPAVTSSTIDNGILKISCRDNERLIVTRLGTFRVFGFLRNAAERRRRFKFIADTLHDILFLFA